MQRLILIISVFLLLYTDAYAAKVLRTKGKNVIIDIRGENIKTGDKINIYQNSKRRGVVRIRKLNKSGTKALARILLGKAKKGWHAGFEAPGEKIEGAQIAKAKTDAISKLNYGLLIGLSMDSMDVTMANTTIGISGNGYSLKGAVDYAFSQSLQARIKTGLELFDASGENSTPGPGECSSCSVEINYFTMEGLAQYYFNQSKYRFWLGLGGAIAHPLSSSTNAVDEDSLSTTSAIQFGGGVDIHLKSGNYIPVEILYSLLPKSDDVQASYITISAGYMF